MKHQDPQDGHSEQRGMGDDGREWILTRSQDGLMLADRAGRCYCCWWWVVMLWSEQFWCGWSGGEEKSAGVSQSVSQAGRPSLRGCVTQEPMTADSASRCTAHPGMIE